MSYNQIFYFSAENPVASYLNWTKAKALNVLISQLLGPQLPFLLGTNLLRLSRACFPKDSKPTPTTGPLHLLFFYLENSFLNRCSSLFSLFICCWHVTFPQRPFPRIPYWTHSFFSLLHSTCHNLICYIFFKLVWLENSSQRTDLVLFTAVFHYVAQSVLEWTKECRRWVIQSLDL